MDLNFHSGNQIFNVNKNSQENDKCLQKKNLEANVPFFRS